MKVGEPVKMRAWGQLWDRFAPVGGYDWISLVTSVPARTWDTIGEIWNCACAEIERGER